jgi:anthranilate synthase
LYAEKVRQARKKFKCGDLFECVLSQSFYEPCPEVPSKLFARLRVRNPAPFTFLVNLGDKEHLVGASPEMYVRVNGRRVETCPISGTIRRGTDPVDDAKQVFKLLANAKEEAELTMCTDVDRNDKSRICEPGSVKVLARRQIEMYSKLIHTVDHVEGIMREGFDALDAFLVHTWAVTVTGAPKSWAIQFLEDMEETPRAWYAGAVGTVHFNGDLNTGLTLRTIQIREGVACVRAGATLLWDSDPEAEEQETMLKAEAFLEALRTPSEVVTRLPAPPVLSVGAGFKVLVIDHQDSFVHTLANYLRQTGAEVRTLRAGFDPSVLDEEKPNMALLSPGPGTPEDFKVSAMIGHLVNRHIPIFGVCLGLQGMVEYFGGTLDVLDEPLHGKPTPITVTDPASYLFKNMAPTFTAARYHSLYAVRDTLPSMLRVTAMSSDGVIMAVEHTRMPMAAVQFHPESILTAHHDGLSILENCIQHFRMVNAAWKPKASAV